MQDIQDQGSQNDYNPQAVESAAQQQQIMQLRLRRWLGAA